MCLFVVEIHTHDQLLPRSARDCVLDEAVCVFFVVVVDVCDCLCVFVIVCVFVCDCLCVCLLLKYTHMISSFLALQETAYLMKPFVFFLLLWLMFVICVFVCCDD